MDYSTATWVYDAVTEERVGIHVGLSSVPIEPANSDYAEIMRQVADEGLVIAEPD